jgi:hypothetical protein
MRDWRNGLGAATGLFRALASAWDAMAVWQRVVWIAAAGLCVGLGVGFFMLPGGFDLLHFYSTLPASRSGSAFNTYNPYWTYFFTWPLALVGWRWNYLLLLIATVGAGVLSAWLLGGRPLVLLLSLPMVWVLWLGQIDALPLLGVALGWWCVKGNRWWLLGLALVLLSVRPQQGLGPALLYLWWAKDRWRPLALPALTLVLSFACWGLDWPLGWFRTLQDFRPTWWNATLWPWGLLAIIPAVGLPADRHTRLRLVTCANLIASPYVAVYHYVVLMAQELPWWVFFLSYTTVLILPFARDAFAWGGILPVSVLLWDTIRSWRSRREWR